MKKLFVLLFFITSNYAFASGIKYEFKSIKSLRYDPRIAGAAVLVLKDNKVLLEEYIGKSDIENNRKVDDETIFESGSVLKMFTAVAIAKLEKEGKVNLNIPAKYYLPKEFFFLPEKIKVYNLLFHTSGLPDYLNDVSLRLNERVNRHEYIDNEFVLEYLKKTHADKKKMDKIFGYSNSNYVLLAKIIENVSGFKYADFMREFVFKPAGMKTAFINEKGIKFDKKEAKTYDCHNNFIVLQNKYYYITSGDFGMQASIKDFRAFIEYLQEDEYIYNKLFSTDGVAYSSCGNEKLDAFYGYGMRHGKLYDVMTYFHGGAINGVKNIFVYHPKFKTFIVILSNTSSLLNADLAGDILAEVDLDDTICTLENEL